MIDLLKILYLLVILGSATTAIYYQRILRTRKIGILAPYLAWVFIQELVLHLLNIYNGSPPNAVVYHVYRVLNVTVFAIIYSRIPFLAQFRRIIIILATMFALITILQLVLFNAYQTPLRYLSLMRGLVLTIYGLFFLFSYFNLDNRKEEKFWTPLFWVTVGVVIFYPVISISLAFQHELKEFGDVYGIRLYQIIPQIGSLFMYSCFIYAFKLCREKT